MVKTWHVLAGAFLIPLIITVVITAFRAGEGNGTAGEQITVDVASDVALPVATPLTPTASQMEIPDGTKEPRQVTRVPRFTESRMRDILVDLGFTCSRSRTEGAERIANCEREVAFLVDLIAYPDGFLKSVSVYSFPMPNVSDSELASTVTEIVTIEYEGADPQRVADWFDAGVRAGGFPEDLVIGGVVFSFLATNPPTLDIALEGY